MVLRACDENALASEWQIAALEVFTHYPCL